MAFNIEIMKERLGELFKNESQEAVGKKLNMTQGNVSKLLTGKQQPTVETIFQIAKLHIKRRIARETKPNNKFFDSSSR
ncbi:MAG: helix-turn-helix domain-containing protein [Lachnospiraceae bacterium]|nr:helix-turn-helix domain-containing protein [Lachnospiraceae bacterium]